MKMADIQQVLEGIKQQLGYTDAEMEMWKSNPKNMEMLNSGRMAEFGKYRVVAEVIKSHGCAMGHKVGDKLIFTGMGGFEGKDPAGPVCISAIGPVVPLVIGVLNNVAAGNDPQNMVFNRIKCFDVGVENGGWGEILMEIKVEKV
jgi:uncharacterized repeat protein (TIGR04076 family)